MIAERRNGAIKSYLEVNQIGEELLSKTKPFEIPKQLVVEAWKRVKQNQGTSGIDGISIQIFEAKLKDNLYKLWNRLSSGSYFPPPVKRVDIPKKDGGNRPLGIPTVADRVAQTMAKMVLEPQLDPCFDEDSYGYRPRKSALDAVAQARKRSWQYLWVIDLDIKGFFDSINHTLLMKAIDRHLPNGWARFYVKRWLATEVQLKCGTRTQRNAGTPQGGVISPLLANLFLHYAFDKWMRRNHPGISFIRYADDILVHCQSQKEAEMLLEGIKKRIEECKLELNLNKTRIVYCGTAKDNVEYANRSFNFLGYTFRQRICFAKHGGRFVGFVPAISHQAAKGIRQTIRQWRLHRKTNTTLEGIAKLVNPQVRGWINYYGRFYRSAMEYTLLQIEYYLKRWVRWKYKRKSGLAGKYWAGEYLGTTRKYKPKLFVHWQYGCGTKMAW
jgi:RNA-directed DNA polymerase